VNFAFSILECVLRKFYIRTVLEKGTKRFKMSEKKVVGRNVAIALGIICVILAVGLVVAIANYNSIINLKKSTVWIDRQTVSQPAGSYTYWRFYAPYAGYVSVRVHSSTTDNTYVRVIWSSHGVNYDHSITVGVSGTAVFPVLPGSIEIRVGNLNLFSGATETVTITYHY